jgi:hypothetical protein
VAGSGASEIVTLSPASANATDNCDYFNSLAPDLEAGQTILARAQVKVGAYPNAPVVPNLNGVGGARIGLDIYSKPGTIVDGTTMLDAKGNAVYVPWGSDWTQVVIQFVVPSTENGYLTTMWVQMRPYNAPANAQFRNTEFYILNPGQSAPPLPPNPPSTPTPPSPTTGSIVVNALQGSTPIAAAVTLDGQSGTTPCTFTAAPGTYIITASYGGTTLPAQSVTVTVGGTLTVDLVFPAPTLTQITLTVAAGAHGTVKPSGTETFTVGQSYSFKATSSTGYQFSHWELNNSDLGSSNPLDLTVTAAMNGQTLTAIFSRVTRPRPRGRR